MLANSFEYLFLVGCIFILFFVIGKFARKYILLFANLYFVLKFSIYSLICIMGFSVYTYIIYTILSKNHKKTLLYCSLIPYLVGFTCFKFTNILIPIGYSFYAFKMISFLIDTFNEKVENVNILDCVIHFTFFPLVLAGPINRTDNFIKQLNEPYNFEYTRMKNGFVLFMFGVFEKMVFSDYIAIIVKKLLDTPGITGIYLLFGIILYSFQIYLDFDSYSNIAIGISKLLGFDVGINFHTPYLAKSISEFWRRWHISLSSWFRDYIYIPLGGNRKGTARKYINIMIVFVLSGVWHGTGLNYLVWGIGHGLLQLVEGVLPKVEIKNKFISKLANILSILVNFILVTFLWIFFRAKSLGIAIEMIQNLFVNKGFSLTLLDINIRQWIWVWIIVLITIITDLLRYRVDAVKWLSKRNFVIRWAVYLILILVFLIFGVYGSAFDPADFIYIQF